MTRVSFFIDGFNLYHSVVEASNELGLGGTGTKWLDLKKMCNSFLRYLPAGSALENVYYFSAYAKHIQASKPQVVARHRNFVRALEDSGVIVEMGKFKAKWVHCKICGQQTRHYEEKGTDVAIALKVFEVCLHNQCDIAVVITGDTDIAPAIRTIQRVCTAPPKEVWIAFPHHRYNTELEDLVTPAGGTARIIAISKGDYTTNQFPDPYIHGKGGKIKKPPSW